MCRLAGWVTTQDHNGEEWLATSEWSLLAQAEKSRSTAHKQKDGWGIGWFVGGQPRVALNPRPVWDTRTDFLREAKDARGGVVIGHVRETSGTTPSTQNTQPFSREGSLLAHNGTVRQKTEVAQSLLGPGVKLLGQNDSEVWFQLLLKNGAKSGKPVGAFRESVRQLDEGWRTYGDPDKKPYTSLNTLFAPSHDELYAFCFSHSEDGKGKFRFTDGTPKFYEMVYLTSGGEVVAASEPLSQSPAWKPLESGKYLRARITSGRIETETGVI